MRGTSVIADLGRSGADEGGGGGVVGHFGDGGDADGVSDGDRGGHVGGRRGSSITSDGKLVAGPDAGAFAEIDGEGVARNLCDEPIEGAVESGNLAGEGVELCGELVDGMSSGLGKERAGKVAVEHLGGGIVFFVGEEGDDAGLVGFPIGDKFGEDLAGGDIEDASGDLDEGLRVVGMNAGGMRSGGVVETVASDGADDEGVEIGDTAHFGSESICVESCGVGLRLLLENLLEGVAVENPVFAASEEFRNELSGGAFANFFGAGTDDVRRDARAVKIEHSDAFLRRSVLSEERKGEEQERQNGSKDADEGWHSGARG